VPTLLSPTGFVPVDDTVVAPDELLNPRMWCAPTVLIQPSVTVASRETLIGHGPALDCAIDAKDKLEEE
jgi:hypothetical protein